MSGFLRPRSAGWAAGWPCLLPWPAGSRCRVAAALPLPLLGHDTTAHYCSSLQVLQAAPLGESPPPTFPHSGRDPPASAPASDLPPSSGGHWSLYPRGHSLTECPSGSLSTWDEVHTLILAHRASQAPPCVPSSPYFLGPQQPQGLCLAIPCCGLLCRPARWPPVPSAEGASAPRAALATLDHMAL